MLGHVSSSNVVLTLVVLSTNSYCTDVVPAPNGVQLAVDSGVSGVSEVECHGYTSGRDRKKNKTVRGTKAGFPNSLRLTRWIH